MNMFGIGGFELLLIALIAFLVLGPKGIADGTKTLGKLVKELRTQRDELTGMVKQAVEEEEDEERARNAPPAPDGAVARPSGARPEPSAVMGPSSENQTPASAATSPRSASQAAQASASSPAPGNPAQDGRA